MPEYQSLLWPDAGPIDPSKKSKSPRLHLRGCEFCSLNEVKGLQKIIGTVRGKDIMVWAQSPGPKENEKGKELIGPSGKWFWERMEEAGLTRDQCDIQNVVRCLPADNRDGRLVMRNPTKEEQFCCSVYTDQAIVKSRAKVHIVLGAIAAKQLFVGEKHKKNERVFWSNKLRGRVVLLDHPAYFIRGYGSPSSLERFKEGLETAARFASLPAGQFTYLKQQDYKGVTTIADAEQAKKDILAVAKKGFRVTVDIEDAWVDGKHLLLSCAFSTKAGWARSFLLQHSESKKLEPEVRSFLMHTVLQLLQDPAIRKAMHYGVHDCDGVKEICDVKIEGYDYDTQWGEFFYDSDQGTYGLLSIAERSYPDFAGFKEVIMPEAAPPKMAFDVAYKAGKLNFAAIPWSKLMLRNCADADITKRIEIRTKKSGTPALMKLYIDAAFTLARMEKNGPLFDYKQCDLLGEIYPARIKKLTQELQVMVGNPDFNPGAPPQVADFIYGTLGIEPLSKKPDTQKDTLELLAGKHPFIPKIMKFRAAAKIESTYRVAFKECALANHDRLLTKWWLTGAKTGRISSGGSKDGEEILTVNLQNIIGDQQLQNMLVSDLAWRDIYQTWKDEGTVKGWWKQFENRLVYLILDYSQNELRFLAQTANDPGLIAQFNSGEDIHCLVGHELTGWPIEVIRNDEKKRKLIKNFHFGLIYGLTEDGMLDYLKAKGVQSTRKEVHDMYVRYFKKYAMVQPYIDAMRQMAQDYGYVENILGFRTPIDVTGESGGGYWENVAVNAPIQGGAHQLLLMALAALKRKSKTYALIGTPHAEIHDAILVSVPLKSLFDSVALSKQLMQNEVLSILQADFGLKWKVPLVADAKAGFRYGVTCKLKEGMTTEQFMQAWCEKNQTSQKALYAEISKIRKANPVN